VSVTFWSIAWMFWPIVSTFRSIVSTLATVQMVPSIYTLYQRKFRLELTSEQTKKRSLVWWILPMTVLSSPATLSASRRRIMKCLSSFDHLAVSARIFSSSLHSMSDVHMRSYRPLTRRGPRSDL
jgi:hypothetical protein